MAKVLCIGGCLHMWVGQVFTRKTCGPVATLQRHCCLQIWVAEPSSREDMQSLVMSYLEGTGPRPPVDSLVDFYTAAKAAAVSAAILCSPGQELARQCCTCGTCKPPDPLRGPAEFKPAPLLCTASNMQLCCGKLPPQGPLV